jgi:hypothetical protein
MKNIQFNSKNDTYIKFCNIYVTVNNNLPLSDSYSNVLVIKNGMKAVFKDRCILKLDKQY